MSFDDRVAAVGIATQFQEHSSEVFKMVQEETEYVKTQVHRQEKKKKKVVCLHARLLLS